MAKRKKSKAKVMKDPELGILTRAGIQAELEPLQLELRKRLDKATFEDLVAGGVLSGIWLATLGVDGAKAVLEGVVEYLDTGHYPERADKKQTWAMLNIVERIRQRQLLHMPEIHAEVRALALSRLSSAVQRAADTSVDDNVAPRDRLTATRLLLDVGGMATPRKVELAVTDGAMAADEVYAQIEDLDTEQVIEAARLLGLPEAQVVTQDRISKDEPPPIEVEVRDVTDVTEEDVDGE